MRSYLQWAAIAAAVHSCAAQTYTSCNPLKKTCSADKGLAKYSLYSDFTSESGLDRWNTTSGTVTSTDLGAKFTIKEEGDAPTIESEFYFFFGYVEFKMRAANGTGIISTSVLESDDLDEIDWEQISTYDDEITTNYFGKGNTTSYDRATTVTVSSPEETFHTYAVNWTPSKTEWFVDGTLVRTLDYADAVDGTNYPQTPMRIRIGIWAGGIPITQRIHRQDWLLHQYPGEQHDVFFKLNHCLLKLLYTLGHQAATATSSVVRSATASSGARSMPLPAYFETICMTIFAAAVSRMFRF
ncbi:cell wall glucanase/allergen F16-like protein [Aspergillus ochraceoroseus]|uniref:chitinase n=1 Tax=Aspergillus ochraceoroseus TaxID=138278 RepID=A0A0F8WN17_9EURO|nr:cell wall glucanase/allergen F16-like protein [Aspergillus ochraceoroseus]